MKGNPGNDGGSGLSGSSSRGRTSKELSNIDIVVYALGLLDGATKKIHTEDIAYESYKLAPDRFSWHFPKYKQLGFPDKDLVRVALTDAAKSKYGELITGRAGATSSGRLSDGWRLTPAGVGWLQKNHDRIATQLGGPALKPRKSDAQRIVQKIKADPLFRMYCERNDLSEATAYNFFDMLGSSPDAMADVLRPKLDRLIAACRLTGDHDTEAFLLACESKFAKYLKGES